MYIDKLTPCLTGAAPTQGLQDYTPIMSIQVTALSEALGAEITGVDLAQEQGPHGFDIINRAWLRHKGEIQFHVDQCYYECPCRATW